MDGFVISLCLRAFVFAMWAGGFALFAFFAVQK